VYAAGAAAILSTGVFAAPSPVGVAFVLPPLCNAALGRSTRSMGKQITTNASLEVTEHVSDAALMRWRVLMHQCVWDQLPTPRPPDKAIK